MTLSLSIQEELLLVWRANARARAGLSAPPRERAASGAQRGRESARSLVPRAPRARSARSPRPTRSSPHPPQRPRPRVCSPRHWPKQDKGALQEAKPTRTHETREPKSRDSASAHARDLVESAVSPRRRPTGKKVLSLSLKTSNASVAVVSGRGRGTRPAARRPRLRRRRRATTDPAPRWPPPRRRSPTRGRALPRRCSAGARPEEIFAALSVPSSRKHRPLVARTLLERERRSPV